MANNAEIVISRAGRVYAIERAPLAEVYGVAAHDRRDRFHVYLIRAPQLMATFDSEDQARRFVESTEAKPHD